MLPYTKIIAHYREKDKSCLVKRDTLHFHMERGERMKKMHFRASCAYAALAELVWREGVDTEDERIVREMDLPYLFTKEENAFAAGTMLQGTAWFELWLKPHGFAMQEQTVVRPILPALLRGSGSCMLGLLTPGGRHAVVYDGFDGLYHFGNPVSENSKEPET